MGNKASASSFNGDIINTKEDDSEVVQKSAPEEPGSIENLHNKAHDVFPVPFSGIKVVVTNGLSPNFHTNHSITLCNGDQAGYRFGANYAGHKKVSENEAYPVLQGEVQPNGQVQAQIVHQFAPSLRMQYMTQLQKSKMSAQQIAADFRQGNWQTNLTVINPDLQRRQVMTALGTMCQVTRRFALGSMFFYHRSPQLPAGQDGTWSIGGKYSGSKWTAAASLRPFHLGLHSSFHMRYDETLQFAAELESNFQQQNNTATIGYQFDFPKGAASVKAQIDSNWNIAASLEKKMFPFTFTLCAMGNQSAERYAVGFGLSLLV